MSEPSAEVSVVIPVYNARPFLEKAVKSALSQGETGEVILVDDASTDGSGQLCDDLAAKYGKVSVRRHPDGGSHGPGTARNIGINAATYDIISLLDADDYYLPDRFKTSLPPLRDNPDLDAVYEATKVEYTPDAVPESESSTPRQQLHTLPAGLSREEGNPSQN